MAYNTCSCTDAEGKHVDVDAVDKNLSAKLALANDFPEFGTDVVITKAKDTFSPNPPNAMTYFAVQDCVPTSDDTCLQYLAGDIIVVKIKTNETWWYASTGGVEGYVRKIHLAMDSEGHPTSVEPVWEDDTYFGEYGVLKIHQEMLADRARTEAYHQAIMGASDFLKGKTVMDVGCGTGVLSIFAARAGAKKVYAIEASDIAHKTRKVVQDNKLDDIVEVINGKIEMLDIPCTVDLIISEWMGTFLVFEYMISSVLVARDKFLRDGGVVWPSTAKLFLVPVEAHTEYHNRVGCWSNQYGIDMSELIPDAKNEFTSRPNHCYVIDPKDMLASAKEMLVVDMLKVAESDLERFEQDLDFVVARAGSVHGFGSWFDVGFGLPHHRDDESVTLSTAPDSPTTHWKQDLFLLDEPLLVEAGDTLTGRCIAIRNPAFRRHLHVHLTLVHDRSKTNISKEFRLWR
eukprot:m.38672 g.38672  ORF g.38672 m.38672 type:complete len:458 (+) comp17983_c1_seq2:570-1943(+)